MKNTVSDMSFDGWVKEVHKKELRVTLNQEEIFAILADHVATRAEIDLRNKNVSSSVHIVRNVGPGEMQFEAVITITEDKGSSDNTLLLVNVK